jgi:hypothetical protein
MGHAFHKDLFFLSVCYLDCTGKFVFLWYSSDIGGLLFNVDIIRLVLSILCMECGLCMFPDVINKINVEVPAKLQ